jgi:hypothetical protein
VVRLAELSAIAIAAPEACGEAVGGGGVLDRNEVPARLGGEELGSGVLPEDDG